MTKIIYKIGDACQSPERALVHGCNSLGYMNSGIARTIRNLWPNVYEVYRLKHQVFGLQLGEVIPVQTPDGRLIINAITQELCGSDGKQYVSYDAIRTVFETINSKTLDWGAKSVAMPRIGAGLGGGDWDTISAIIEETSRDYQPIVYDLP